MPKADYVEGEKLGNLIFLNRLGTDDSKHPMANFKCECGKVFACRVESVKNLITKSCGCARSRFVSESQTVHGHGINGLKSSEYGSWNAMKSRCSNPKVHNHKNYKERGVTVCEEWNDFSVFLADMGLKPSKEYTIERIDNNKGYYKENCKWATKKEQQRNTRITTFIDYKGFRKSTAEWAELIGFPLSTLYGRIFLSKWDVERAFTEPSKNIIPKIITN